MAVLLSLVKDAEGLVDGVNFCIEDFLVLAKAKVSAGPPACGFPMHATPRFPLPSREPSIQIMSESRPFHPSATCSASSLFWTMIRPGKESLPLHCCGSTVLLVLALLPLEAAQQLWIALWSGPLDHRRPVVSRIVVGYTLLACGLGKLWPE